MRRNTRIGYVPQDADFPRRTRRAAEVIAEAIAGEHLDDLERAARINQTLGPRRLHRRRGAHRVALRRLEAAPRHRARTGARSPTCSSSTSPPTTSISKASSGSRSCSPARRSPAWWSATTATSSTTWSTTWPRSTASIPRASSASRAATASFLEKKEEFLLAQSSRQESLANKVRREVEWLRRGAKARTGKSKARIDEAGRLIRELSRPGIAQRQRARRRSISPPPTGAPSGWSRSRASPRNSAAARCSATSASRSRPARASACSG